MFDITNPIKPEVAMVAAPQMLDRISDLATELKLTNLRPQIAACRELVSNEQSIDVVVFGRFKAGKSSFLNHLAGQPVLPVGVVPLTAVITRLRFGQEESAAIHFQNGTKEEVGLSSIDLYIDEAKNPNNERKVQSVEIMLPSLKPIDPLQFVDTPGIGSAYLHNTATSLNWLPRTGAAVLAVSSDSALSAQDLEFLDALKIHTPRIVLLLTKADLLTESQRQQVRTFVVDQLRQKQKEPVPIFFFSIKPELAGMNEEFLKGFLQPLRERGGLASQQILRHKLESLRSQTLDYLRVALSAATQADSARQALRDQLEQERRQFGLFRNELNVMTRELATNALDEYLRRLAPIQRSLQAKVTDELRRKFRDTSKIRTPQFLHSWREWLQAFLARELSEISAAQRPMFCEPAEVARKHLIRSARAFRDRLAEHVRAALSVTLSPWDFPLEVPEPVAPPVNVNYAFDAAFTTISGIIPATLFRKPIERVLLRKARYEVEKNISRLAADWSQRIRNIIEELRKKVAETACDELTTLIQMVGQTSSDVPCLHGQMEELTNMPTCESAFHRRP